MTKQQDNNNDKITEDLILSLQDYLVLVKQCQIVIHASQMTSKSITEVLDQGFLDRSDYMKCKDLISENQSGLKENKIKVAAIEVETNITTINRDLTYASVDKIPCKVEGIDMETVVSIGSNDDNCVCEDKLTIDVVDDLNDLSVDFCNVDNPLDFNVCIEKSNIGVCSNVGSDGDTYIYSDNIFCNEHDDMNVLCISNVSFCTYIDTKSRSTGVNTNNSYKSGNNSFVYYVCKSELFLDFDVMYCVTQVFLVTCILSCKCEQLNCILSDALMEAYIKVVLQCHDKDQLLLCEYTLENNFVNKLLK